MDRHSRRFPVRLPSLSFLLVLLILALTGGCSRTSRENTPTVEEAVRFTDRAEQRLLELGIKAERAAWVQSNFITFDSELIAAAALKDLVAATGELGKEATRYESLDLPEDVRRKLKLIRTSLSLAAPADPAKQTELTEITTALEGIYGRGKYCPEGKPCLELEEMSRIMAESRNEKELLDVWQGWRTVSPAMKDKYARFVELANEGARELNFSDLGALWRSGYDMPPEAFSAEMDRLWEQVKPLYDALHCHVRARLAEMYGSDIVKPGEPLPAHLLGNMWSQQWNNIYELVAPPAFANAVPFDLDQLLRRKNLDAKGMVRYGEQFFTSLGFAALPATFWERSLLTKPADRDVVCHASAWDVDGENDLRIKICIEVTAEDFSTIHHELGHNFYQRAYAMQPPLFRGGANDGFHEGIGDTIALSITPEYLAEIGLLDKAPPPGRDLDLLMKMALDKVAFLPFGLLVDKWRWQVFSGEVTPADYNAAWWKLRRQYQGIQPPVERSESDFDPGAKYHVPANTPYARYFLAHILQFQFHRALCQAAGYEGPLHRCSIYGNKEAGRRLAQMLEMGMSRPWPDALEALTGQREMDAGAILDYFAPLKTWLDEQNAGRSCGWQ